MKKQNQPQKGMKQNNMAQTQQNYVQEASEELMQEKGMQKTQKQQKKMK
ncbi:MAG: hypothetical protein PWQ67_1780 [Clostridia bacterium]|jgi:hypothetical protein|nr:hypothetical protein [Clostridia bacterium]MDN5323326.1 hypothetical protein [Clostridia bacterium]